jgi:6-phosphogluconolactonase
MQLIEQLCAGASEQALLLAHAVADDLRAAIDARGHASLAVSGGKSPIAMFEALRHTDLNWAEVTITLVDERVVPHDHADSNTGLVRAHLLQSRAAASRFLPLFEAPIADLDALARSANEHTSNLGDAVDVAVLGMGEDGHTASLFGGARNIEVALGTHERYAWTDPKPGAGVAPYPRLTMSLAALSAARHLHLSVAGPSKRAVLEIAKTQTPTEASVAQSTHFPIALVLQRATRPVRVWLS